MIRIEVSTSLIESVLANGCKKPFAVVEDELPNHAKLQYAFVDNDERILVLIFDDGKAGMRYYAPTLSKVEDA